MANLDILYNFVELGRTVTKGSMVAHLNKTNNLKDKISMVRLIIWDIFLKEELVIMLRRKSFITFVGGGMHRVSVGLKVKIMGVVIMEEIIPQMSVVNLTRSLVCLQNKEMGPYPVNNRRQVPPTNPGSSNSQDVMFIDGTTEPRANESFPLHVARGEKHINGLHMLRPLLMN